MKPPRIRAVEMTPTIRDRHARRLAKTPEEVIAFYRAAGQAALEDARHPAKPRGRRAG